MQMQNRMAVLMCNLKPAKMRGVVSQAMVMCASSPDKVEILDPPAGSVPGDRLTFQGFPGTPVHPSDWSTGPGSGLSSHVYLGFLSIIMYMTSCYYTCTGGKGPSVFRFFAFIISFFSD